MVTGQALVLYSRLHLVYFNDTVLRIILWMIIVSAIVIYVPLTVLAFGSITGRVNTGPFGTGFFIMEKIEVMIFGAEELVLSLLYIRPAASFYSTDRKLNVEGSWFNYLQ